VIDAGPEGSVAIYKQHDRILVRYVFREVPALADGFPSRTVEAYNTTLRVCPKGAVVVPNDRGRVGPYTIPFAIALEVAVPQDADLALKPECDPQAAIRERQQAAQRPI